MALRTLGVVGSLCVALAAASMSCASPQTSATGSGDAGGGAPDGGGPGSTGAGGDLPFDAGSGGGDPLPAVLYAHTNTTLYRGDPSVDPLSMDLVGAFDCIGGAGQDTSMTDLAVSEAGDIWAVSGSFFYRLEVDGGVVHCAATFPLNNPADIQFYGLTFAPKGVFDPQKEVLVAANSAGELFTIDDAGNLAPHGTFGSVPASDGSGYSYPAANVNKPWVLSGDIVFLANGGDPIGFATVRDCPDPPSSNGCNKTDTLIELDVAGLPSATTQSITKGVRGALKKRPGCADADTQSYGGVYGVTAWQSKVFGFSRASGDGYAIDIDNADATACVIQPFPGSAWAGAGITTLAPVVPPPPK